MADKLLVSTDELNTGVQNYRQAKSDVMDSLSGMKNAISALDGDWLGSASGACVSAFDGLYAAIMRTEDLMEEAVRELQAFSALAQEAEDEQKNMGGQVQSMQDSL